MVFDLKEILNIRYTRKHYNSVLTVYKISVVSTRNKTALKTQHKKLSDFWFYKNHKHFL